MLRGALDLSGLDLFAENRSYTFDHDALDALDLSQ